MVFKHLTTRMLLCLLVCGLLLQAALLWLYQQRMQQHSQQQISQVMQQGDVWLVQQLQQQQARYRSAIQILLRQHPWIQSGLPTDETVLRLQLATLRQTLQADSIALLQPDRVLSDGAGSPRGLSHARAQVAATSRQLQFDVIDGRLQLVLWWPLLSADGRPDWLMLGYPMPAVTSPSLQGESALTLTAWMQDAQQHWQPLTAYSTPVWPVQAEAALSGFLRQARGLLLVRQPVHYDGLLGRRVLDQRGHTVFIGLHGQFRQLLVQEQHWRWLWGWSLLLVLLLWLLALAYLCRDITRVLANLQNCMAEAEAGNPGNMMPLARADELGQLVQAYNRMVTTITQRQHSLQQLAFEDATTQLANRHALEAALQQHLEMPDTRAQPLYVLVLSIRAYAAMLQSMGPDFCRSLLQQLASHLAAQLPSMDDVVARWDEQSFALLLHLNNQTALASIADRLLQPYRVPVNVQGQSTYLRLLLGIARYPEHGHDAKTLLLHAEAAQQTAQAQQALWALYQPETAEPVFDTRHISRLQTAIREQQLQLRVMPVVHCKHRTVVAMQAELCWPEAEAAETPQPSLSILAEQTGLIHALTEWQLTQACAAILTCQQLDWRLPLCLPLSARALQQADFATALLSRLAEAGIPLPALQLQFSSRRLHPLSPRALSQLQQLHVAGMLITLTDIGDSTLPLSSLSQYPLGALALAAELLPSLEQQPKTLAVVKSCLDLGQNLGLPVTAMAVQEAQTLTLLAQMGCDYACGSLFAPAMRMQDFPVWAERWHTAQTSTLSFELNPSQAGLVADAAAGDAPADR